MFGGVVETENVPELVVVPCRVATVILPVVAPAGTPAEIVVAVCWKNGASTPLNCTECADPKLLPLIVTVVAIGSRCGENEEIDGGGGLAAFAGESPSTDSRIDPARAIALRSRRRLIEDGTAPDLLERRERVGVLVDAEIHGRSLEVREGVRVDHRLHASRRPRPGLDRVSRLGDPLGLGLRAGPAAHVGANRSPLLDHHALADREGVLVRGVEDVRERLPEVVAGARATVVAVHPDVIAARWDPRAGSAVRAVVRDALERGD